MNWYDLEPVFLCFGIGVIGAALAVIAAQWFKD